jgi:hypothetical protein
MALQQRIINEIIETVATRVISEVSSGTLNISTPLILFSKTSPIFFPFILRKNISNPLSATSQQVFGQTMNTVSIPNQIQNQVGLLVKTEGILGTPRVRQYECFFQTDEIEILGNFINNILGDVTNLLRFSFISSYDVFQFLETLVSSSANSITDTFGLISCEGGAGTIMTSCKINCAVDFIQQGNSTSGVFMTLKAEEISEYDINSIQIASTSGTSTF